MESILDLAKSTVETPRDFNFREKMNVYVGAAIGALAPIVTVRYGLLHDAPAIPAWLATATLMLGPYVPLSGAALGGAAGRMAARDLMSYRKAREQELESLASD